MIFFFLYLVLGTFIRYQYWSLEPPELDVGDYGGYSYPAIHMSHPYDTGVREPFWIWILKLWFTVTGTASHEGTLYLASALGFLWFPLILFLSMKFAERYFGKWEAVILGWILSVSNYQIFHEFLGLREPFEAVLVLLLLMILIPKDSGAELTGWKKRTIFLLSVCLMLTRLAYVQILFLILPIFFYLNKWRIKTAFLTLILAYLFTIPYSLYSYTTYGDSNYFSHWNLGAMWTRDFKHRIGFPNNPEEWAQVGDYFKPMTLREFLFKYHKWWQVPSVVLEGIYRYLLFYGTITGLLIWRYPIERVIRKMFPFHMLILMFYLLGYYSILREPGKRRFALLILLIMAPYFLIGHIQVNLRYNLCVAPLIVMVLAHGMVFAFNSIPLTIGIKRQGLRSC